MAGLARDLRHVVLIRLAHLVAVRLAVAAREQRHHALERHIVFLALAEHIRIAEFVACLPRAVEQRFLRLLVDVLPRRIQRVAGRLEQRAHGAHRIGVRILRERREDARRDGERGIRQHELLVELHVTAEPHADRAGTIGIVERKHARRDLRQADAAVHAGEILTEHQKLAADDLHIDDALAELERCLERVREPRVNPLAHDETIHDHLDGMLLVLLKGDLLVHVVDLAVNAHAHVAFMADMRERLLVLALLPAHDLCHDEQLRALGQREDTVDHLVDGLLRDGLAALGAMRPPGPREEQAQIVVDLRYRADRRARIVARRLLVDGDGGRQAIDAVHVRLVHLPEELTRVGRERLHIATLPLRVDGIERERGLPRSGEPRDDDELVARNLQTDILQVMGACALDLDAVFHTGSHPLS